MPAPVRPWPEHCGPDSADEPGRQAVALNVSHFNLFLLWRAPGPPLPSPVARLPPVPARVSTFSSVPLARATGMPGGMCRKMRWRSMQPSPGASRSVPAVKIIASIVAGFSAGASHKCTKGNRDRGTASSCSIVLADRSKCSASTRMPLFVRSTAATTAAA